MKQKHLTLEERILIQRFLEENNSIRYIADRLDVAMAVLPEDFFIFLGLEKIPADKVLLKPALLTLKTI